MLTGFKKSNLTFIFFDISLLIPDTYNSAADKWRLLYDLSRKWSLFSWVYLHYVLKRQMKNAGFPSSQDACVPKTYMKYFSDHILAFGKWKKTVFQLLTHVFKIFKTILMALSWLLLDLPKWIKHKKAWFSYWNLIYNLQWINLISSRAQSSDTMFHFILI